MDNIGNAEYAYRYDQTLNSTEVLLQDKAAIEFAQTAAFETVCRVLTEHPSEMIKYFIALKTSVPVGGISGFLRHRSFRKPCDLNQEEIIPDGYWADVIIFPVANQGSGLKERHGKQLTIPVITSYRKHFTLFGEWEIINHQLWEGEIKKELPMMPQYVNELDEQEFLNAGFAASRIIGA